MKRVSKAMCVFQRVLEISLFSPKFVLLAMQWSCFMKEKWRIVAIFLQDSSLLLRFFPGWPPNLNLLFSDSSGLNPPQTSLWIISAPDSLDSLLFLLHMLLWIVSSFEPLFQALQWMTSSDLTPNDLRLKSLSPRTPLFPRGAPLDRLLNWSSSPNTPMDEILLRPRS